MVTEDKNKPRSAAAIARWEREKAHSRQLQRETLEMRKAGFSYRQIAEVHGCSVATSLKRYKKAIARDVPGELIEHTRTLELDRYDAITQMNMALLQKAYESGDVEAFCKIQNQIHSVHDRRKGIVPIAVPAKLVVDQSVTTQTEQDRELADLLGKAAQDVEDKVRWLTQQHLG